MLFDMNKSRFDLARSNMPAGKICWSFPSMVTPCFPTLILHDSRKNLPKTSQSNDSKHQNHHGQRTSGGKLIKIASIFPPVFKPNNVPRS